MMRKESEILPQVLVFIATTQEKQLLSENLYENPGRGEACEVSNFQYKIVQIEPLRKHAKEEKPST